jgi:hypothetical protein
MGSRPEDFSQLSLLPSLLKVRLMNKHGVHHPYKFRRGSQDGHLVGQPFPPSLVEVGSEDAIGENNGFCHEPDDPPEVSVAPLAEPALSRILPGLIR